MINSQKTNKINNVARKVIIFLAVLLVLATIVGIFVFNKMFTYTIHENNIDEAQSAITKYFGTDNAEALHITKQGDYMFVLYQDSKTGRSDIVIFESSSIFGNRYKIHTSPYYLSSSPLNSPIKFYGEYIGSPLDHSVLIVVYGINKDVQAYYYTFENLGKTYIGTAIEGDYFIHVYYLGMVLTPDIQNGKLYDASNEFIGTFA
ncbi:MAG: hypothetical protein FWF37_02745 [Chloroflexi bacterium]|nr:hypothetical protein [Chloroflexota bacterium]